MHSGSSDGVGWRMAGRPRWHGMRIVVSVLGPGGKPNRNLNTLLGYVSTESSRDVTVTNGGSFFIHLHDEENNNLLSLAPSRKFVLK
jgi:hypothetical protein